MGGHTSKNIGAANIDFDGAVGVGGRGYKVGWEGKRDGLRKNWVREADYDQYSLDEIVNELI